MLDVSAATDEQPIRTKCTYPCITRAAGTERFNNNDNSATKLHYITVFVKGSIVYLKHLNSSKHIRVINNLWPMSLFKEGSKRDYNVHCNHYE